MQKRHPPSIRNILLLTIGALSLLVAIFTLLQVAQQWQLKSRIQTLKGATLLGDQLFTAAEELAFARDITFLLLHSADQQTVADLSAGLRDSRKAADDAFDAASATLRQYNLPDIDARMQKIWANHEELRRLRREIDRQVTLPMNQREGELTSRWFAVSTGLIQETRRLWIDFIARFTDIDARFALQIRFKFFIANITENTGQTRALIGRLLLENAQPSPDEQAQLLRWQGALDFHWTTARELAEKGGLYTAVEAQLNDAKSQYGNLHDMVREAFYTIHQDPEVEYPLTADIWMELAAQASETLKDLKDAALVATQKYIDGLASAAQRAILIRLAVLVLALGLCVICFRIVTERVLRPIHDMVEALVDAVQGKEVVPLPVAAGRQDEIGKLADVLTSFQKRMAEIRRYNRDLERSNKELDDFAYIAAHDLKEPLRGIHNHARFLQEDNAGKLDEESLKRIDRLIYLSQRIDQLVSDLQYFSRLGRQELAVQPTDINAVVEDIESTMDVFIEQNNARIVIPKTLPTVVCDRLRVTEVFRNLMVNGIKYNNSKEKKVEIGFIPSCKGAEGKTFRDVFYVKDNGRGILPEFHEEIFRIFRRIENVRRTQDEGTGVGLTFVKKIVERHGGKIWLTSEPGKGTTFYFTLKEEEEAKNDRKAIA